MTKLKTRAIVPVFILAVYILLALTKLIPTDKIDSVTKLFLTMIVLQFLVFVLPFAIRCKLSGNSYLKKLRLNKFDAKKIPMLVYLLFVMMFGGLLLNAIAYSAGLGNSEFTSGASYILSDISTNTNVIYVVIAFAAVPSICEEIFFRGLVFSEYGIYGNTCAFVMSSLAFSMSHFDLRGLLSYALSGVILAYALYITNSLYSAILLHFFSNICNIYLLPPFWNLIIQPLGIVFAMFIVIAILFVFLILAFRSSEKLFYKRAVTLPDITEENTVTRKKFRYPTVRALICPTFIACILVFLITAIINLFN